MGMVAALAVGKMDAIVTKVKTKIKAIVYTFDIFFIFFPSFFFDWVEVSFNSHADGKSLSGN